MYWTFSLQSYSLKPHWPGTEHSGGLLVWISWLEKQIQNINQFVGFRPHLYPGLRTHFQVLVLQSEESPGEEGSIPGYSSSSRGVLCLFCSHHKQGLSYVLCPVLPPSQGGKISLLTSSLVAGDNYSVFPLNTSRPFPSEPHVLSVCGEKGAKTRVCHSVCLL